MSQKNAILCLSGGLDSATVGILAKEQGFILHGLSFSYGQRHSVELEAAKRVASYLALADHRVAHLDLRLFGGSALTDDIEVPKEQSVQDIKDEIPVTYVPARNTIFLSYALAYAEVVGAFDIFIGVNAVDYSGYPDCRPDYIAAYEAMANQAIAAASEGRGKVTIHTPLIHMSKAEIITAGVERGLDYAMTISCYDPSDDGRACGTCHACLLRKKGFEDANIDDPTHYR